MNENVKRLWVEALRSGKYKQGHGALCNIDTFTKEKTYCCLGVLIDLYQREHKYEIPVEEKLWKKGNSIEVYDDNCSHMPPQVVSEWAEFYEDGSLQSSPNILGITIWRYNDIEMYSFSKIADLIEEHL